MNVKKYKLYSSEGCHLCEQAFALCQQVGIAEQVELIDIVEDEKLVELYGVAIPVLENTENNIEKNNKLFWPFDREQIENLK